MVSLAPPSASAAMVEGDIAASQLPSPVSHSPARWSKLMLPLEICWTPTLCQKHHHICKVAGAVGQQGWLSSCWLLCRKLSPPLWTPARGKLPPKPVLSSAAALTGHCGGNIAALWHRTQASSFQGPCWPLHLVTSVG